MWLMAANNLETNKRHLLKQPYLKQENIIRKSQSQSQSQPKPQPQLSVDGVIDSIFEGID